MTKTGPDDRESPVGADVDRAWRKLSREEPSASLDASILAAAHREAGARPQAAGAKEAIAERRRWWPIAAAATVAAIAIGVLQLTPPEDIGAPAQHATVSDMPAPPAKKTEAIPAAPAVQENAAPAASSRDHRAPSDPPRAVTMPRQAAASPTPEPFPAAPKRADAGANVSAAPPASPMVRKEALAAPATTGSVAAEQASPTAGAAAAAAVQDARKAEAAAPVPSPAAAPLGAARLKDRAPLPIPDWIALIRHLRDVGDMTRAANELAEFRAAHADHEKLLPPDLRDWHPPEK